MNPALTKMVNLNKSKPENDTSSDISNVGDDSALSDDKATIKAQEIVDSIADQPEVCHALYSLLEDKYSNTNSDIGEEEGGGEGPMLDTKNLDSGNY